MKNRPSLFKLAVLSATFLPAPFFCSAVRAEDAPTPGEIVKNPGFEQQELGTLENWSQVPFVTTVSSASHSGAHSLRIESNDAEFSPISVQDIRTFAPKQTYRLRYNVKADKFGVEYRVYIGLWKDAPKDAPAGTPPSEWIDGVDTNWRQGGEFWQTVSTDFTPAENVNRLMVVLQVKGPGAVWFDNVSITPRKAEDAATAITTTPAPAAQAPASQASAASAAPGVTITADRRFLRDGKPFFPLQIWGWTPYSEEALATAREWGFNLVGTPAFRETGPAPTKTWLDAAQRQGLQAMVTIGFNYPPDKVEEFRPIYYKQVEAILPVISSHPATFGYNIADEPAWAGFDADAFNESTRWLKAKDPTHPAYVNHAPRNTIAELRRYNEAIDIAGSDIYPVWHDGVDRHSDLPNKTISVVGDETIKNLTAVDFKKPVMQTLQGFAWSAGERGTPNPDPFPTQHQSRFMAWDSVVAGATGIAWFQDERYKQLRPELKPIVHEFAGLQDVLAGGEIVPAQGAFPAPIKTIAYRWKGHTVLIAINPTSDAVSVQPKWSTTFGAKPGTLRVLHENRKVGAQAESFAAFDVHIYTDAATDAEILRPGFEVEPVAP